ncbi:PRC-barrel domain-containing protein [Streptomyces chartreusis]|uniref:PRC-barrel domain-containing protein n=1 Tax=Streptomyces chartreusis TaxID=1969 RepID=UPI002E7FDA34|nr:PRC-barrel domain-containing protein [Streptomyces chartreusis]WUB22731.1 PRC-barrel domain-containing protein [Streptomyces chartreusis]
MSTERIWSYAPESGHQEGHELTGYSVEASDGTIGHVDRQADDTPLRHLIVDTGAWVFGRSLLIPAGLVTVIAEENRVITVRCTRAEAKAAPRFGTDRETLDPEYLSAVGGYYASLPHDSDAPG